MAGEAYSGSEYDVEQQMYYAMSVKMQSDGLDVTPEEIAHAVEEQSTTNPTEPSENDEEIMAQMAAYQAEHQQNIDAYVVRGALLKCRYGSHCRRLNLLKCHGVYTLGHPIMFQADCVGGTEGDNINVTSFGVCSSPSNQSGESVCLKKEAPRNEDGSFKDENAEGEGTVTGIACVPDIIGQWEGTHEDAHIGPEGKEALITSSFLVCRYGGLIEIIRSGQEDSDE